MLVLDELLVLVAEEDEVLVLDTGAGMENHSFHGYQQPPSAQSQTNAALIVSQTSPR